HGRFPRSFGRGHVEAFPWRRAGRRTGPVFHGHLAVATLKLPPGGRLALGQTGFPRSFGRGHVEGTAASASSRTPPPVFPRSSGRGHVEGQTSGPARNSAARFSTVIRPWPR